MKPAVMQLGRYGDILNILPLLFYLNERGQRNTLFVAREFESVKNHITYADVEVFPGPFEDYHGGCTFAKARQLNPLLKASVYGKNFIYKRETPNFCQEAYHRCSPEYGRMFANHEFDKIRLDTTPHGHEGMILAKYLPKREKPIVLMNFNTISSPLPDANKWKSVINLELGTDYTVLDLGEVRAPSLLDLVALYQRADLLITADTGTLHLAGATDLPYIAFQNDLWESWFMGYTRGNCILKVKYSQQGIARNQVIHAARKALE